MNRQKVMIVGAGNQGLALTAYLSANHVECFLYNRTICHIQKIIETKEIVCKGIWDRKVNVSHVSSRMEEVLQKTIIVTTPACAHKEIASLLARFVDSSYMILLSPGKVFGIIDFCNSLTAAGCRELPVIAECQSTICASRREGENGVRVYALKDNIPIAAFREEDTQKAMNDLPESIRKRFRKVNSFIETSFGNIGMVLHPLPMLLNFGTIDSKKTFKYYTEGITPVVAGIIERLDMERLEVAHRLGYDLESITDWMKRTYGTEGDGLYEHLQMNTCYRDIVAPASINNRFIEEDVPYGLVPLEDTARKLNIRVPVTTEIISFASMIMNCDYRKYGRHCKLL